MKKVILENRKEEVYLSDLNENSVVGILWKSNNKSTILFDNGEFKGLDRRSLVISCSWSKSTISGYLNSAKKEVKEVFVFDSQKELFKWFSED